MINRSGDFVEYCLVLSLVVFVAPEYKGWASWGWFSSLLSLPFHHTFPTQITMSPAHSSFLFSFKEDACTSDVVELMEQVGDLASLCLK